MVPVMVSNFLYFIWVYRLSQKWNCFKSTPALLATSDSAKIRMVDRSTQDASLLPRRDSFTKVCFPDQL